MPRRAPIPTGRAMASSLSATIAANLPTFLTGALAVQMRAELDFGPTALGFAVGVFYAAGALSSPFTGRVVERLGSQRALRQAAFVSGVIQLGIAALATSYAHLVLLLVIGGLANAYAQPAANVLLVRVVPPHRLGLALGLQKSAIPAAALLGGLAVPTIALTAGWRWAFVAGAVGALAATFHVPAEVRRAPGQARPARSTARPDVATRHLLLLSLGVGLGATASNALSAFLVLSSTAAGLGEGLAGWLLTVGSVAGVGVRLAVGTVADRRPQRALSLMVALFVAATVPFLMMATGWGWAHVVATPLAFTTAYAWPGLFHLAVVRANPSAPGAATGVAMIGTLSGSVAGPIVFGAIAGVSYGLAWVSATGFLVAAAAIVTLAARHVRVPDAPSAPVDGDVPALARDVTGPS